MRQTASCALPMAVLLAAVAAAADAPEKRLDDDGRERVPLNTVAPAYPEVARRDRVEGDVQVCFNVDREGRPYRIAVRSSTNRVFEKPAIRAIRASRYQPVPEHRAVPAIKTCRTFRFRLESAAAD
ncbi:MAG TPA: energy transducer TonB [Woeseiaceae bacterium]|nr:energy transducer TonB [Woeseiaceae bacterium]